MTLKFFCPRHAISLVVVVLCSCGLYEVGGFVVPVSKSISLDSPPSSLQMIFGDLGKFFSSFDGEEGNGANNEVTEGEDDVAGSTRVLFLPAESIKPGGLRLFLMLYLMGMQNTPEKGSWIVDQPTTEEYAIDLFYHDRSAALMIRLTDEDVIIDRVGSTPSTSYTMQESVIVDGILDELQRMVTEGDIKREDRLLLLKNENAIADARDTLSFG